MKLHTTQLNFDEKYYLRNKIIGLLVLEDLSLTEPCSKDTVNQVERFIDTNQNTQMDVSVLRELNSHES